MEKSAIAFPLSIGPQISANIPGALDNGLLANVPVKNLPTNKLLKFGAKAQRKLNTRYSVKEM